MAKHDINIEEFKELIDSRKQSAAEKKTERDQLLAARLESYKNADPREQIMVQLYRLKLLLEEEAKTEKLHSPFCEYSRFYVDTLYKTRKSFAEDIDFSEAYLSLILSGSRPPTEEFVSKIKLHSNKIYRKINMDFNPHNWFVVFNLEKMYDYLNKNKDKVSFKNLNKELKSLKL